MSWLKWIKKNQQTLTSCVTSSDEKCKIPKHSQTWTVLQTPSVSILPQEIMNDSQVCWTVFLGRWKQKRKWKFPFLGTEHSLISLGGRNSSAQWPLFLFFFFFLDPHIDGSLRFIIKLDEKSEERKGWWWRRRRDVALWCHRFWLLLPVSCFNCSSLESD